MSAAGGGYAGTRMPDIVITEELLCRGARPSDPARENAALHSLARSMADDPDKVLQRLADLAASLCGAGSAGVSLRQAQTGDAEVLKWLAVSGRMARHQGGTTPRRWSPSGVCLDTGSPVLFSYPERYYTYLQYGEAPVVELLELPLFGRGMAIGTLWAASHDEHKKFDSEDVRILNSLANFTTAILNWRIESAERKAAEEALLEREERLRMALDSAHMATWDWDIRKDLMRCSEELKPLVGLPAGSLVRKLEDLVSRICPEDRDTVRRSVLRAVAKRSSYDIEFRVDWPDGSRHWLACTGKIVGDDAGMPVRMIGVARDITAPKLIEMRLREATEVWETVVENSPLAIMTVELDGTVRSWNRAAEQMFGWSAYEVLGHALPLVPAERREEYDELSRSVREGRVVLGHETVFSTRDGRSLDVSLSRSPLRGAGGEVYAYVGVAEDISARKRIQEELREAQRMESVGLLAGGVAHNLNNLMVGILGNVSLAIEGLPPGARRRGMLEEVLQITQRAAELTSQLLAYAGKGRFFVEAAELSQVVQSMTGLLRSSVRPGVRLHFDLCERLPAIEADLGQIRQTVLNLVLNASEAIGERGGTVTIATSRHEVREPLRSAAGGDLPPGEYVILRVADDGCGMDPQILGRIFDPFFSTKFTGRGLGLAAVSGVVRGCQGGLTVSSEPGNGSVFQLYLPVAAARRTAGSRAGIAAQAPATGSTQG